MRRRGGPFTTRWVSGGNVGGWKSNLPDTNLSVGMPAALLQGYNSDHLQATSVANPGKTFTQVKKMTSIKVRTLPKIN